jgi:hypothetical protein
MNSKPSVATDNLYWIGETAWDSQQSVGSKNGKNVCRQPGKMIDVEQQGIFAGRFE